jgi:hypothetical protein
MLHDCCVHSIIKAYGELRKQGRVLGQVLGVSTHSRNAGNEERSWRD